MIFIILRTDILSFLLDPSVTEKELEPLKQDVGMDVVNTCEDSSVVETNSAEKNEIVEETSAVENKETCSNSQVTIETDVNDDTAVASIVASIDDAMKEDSPIINSSNDPIKSQQEEIVAQEVAEVVVDSAPVDGNSETIIANDEDPSEIEPAKEENANIVETVAVETNSPLQEVTVETITEPLIEETNIALNTGIPDANPQGSEEISLEPSVSLEHTDAVPESVESVISVPDDDDSTNFNTAIEVHENTAAGPDIVNISEDTGTEEKIVSDSIELKSEAETKEPSTSDPIPDDSEAQTSESAAVETAASAPDNTSLDTASDLKTEIVLEELIEDENANTNTEEDNIVQDSTEEKPATALEDKENGKEDLVDEEQKDKKSTDTILEVGDSPSLVEEVVITSLETSEELNTIPMPAEEEKEISSQSDVEIITKDSADSDVRLESTNITELATKNNQEEHEPEATIDSETVVLRFEDTSKSEESVEPAGVVSEDKEHSEIIVEIEKYEEDVKVVASEWDIAGEVVESSLVEDEEQAIGSDQARSAAFLTEVLSASDEDAANSAIDTTEITNDTCARDDISFEETLPTQQETIQLSSEDSILDEPLTTDDSEHFTTNTSSISEHSDIHESKSSITASVPGGGNIVPEEPVPLFVREEPFMQQREKSITSSPRLAEDKSRATKKDEKKKEDSNVTVKVAALLVIVIAWIMYHILKS